jgi:hypothetical protein
MASPPSEANNYYRRCHRCEKDHTWLEAEARCQPIAAGPGIKIQKSQKRCRIAQNETQYATGICLECLGKWQIEGNVTSGVCIEPVDFTKRWGNFQSKEMFKQIKTTLRSELLKSEAAKPDDLIVPSTDRVLTIDQDNTAAQAALDITQKTRVHQNPDFDISDGEFMTPGDKEDLHLEDDDYMDFAEEVAAVESAYDIFAGNTDFENYIADVPSPKGAEVKLPKKVKGSDGRATVEMENIKMTAGD